MIHPVVSRLAFRVPGGMSLGAGRALLVLALGLAATAVGVAPVGAQQTVVVAGQVSNGTPGGRLPGDTTVTVIAARAGRPVEQGTATLQPDGRFEASGLPGGDDVGYVARIEHDGVPYWSELVRPDRGNVPPLRLTVYERTDDPAKIAVERHSVAVLRPDAGARGFDVLELVVLRNDGDRTWAPRADGPAGPMGLLRFSLPDGAAELRPGGALAGEELFFADRGFATQMPVQPGRQEVTFAYRINYGAGRYVLTKTLPYAVGSFQVQVPADIAGSAVGLAELPPEAQTGGSNFRQFGGRDLPARTTIALHLQNLPGAPLPVLAEPVRWGALGVGLLTAGAAGLYALRAGPRERRARPWQDAAPQPDPTA